MHLINHYRTHTHLTEGQSSDLIIVMNQIGNTDQTESSGYAWTTGNDPALQHIQVIDKGASGEVHKVPSL